MTAAAYAHMLRLEAELFAGHLDQVIRQVDAVSALFADHDHLQPLMGLLECDRLLASAYAGDSEVAASARQLQQRAERQRLADHRRLGALRPGRGA